jgi:hypothetical protein
MMGFVMPRPLPPVPPSRREMAHQRRLAERRFAPPRARPDSEVRSRPYNWSRDGI